ncbi:MAG: alpha/beta fold hydrolase, partial [Stenotrophobium sp.]
MPIAQINGQKLYYEDTGGKNPAVIFSHGLLMDHEMFAPQVDALRGRYRVITWDERGHGQTNDAAAPFSYYDSADDLAALLKHLGVDKAVLAGMSQGGYLSLRAALRHPQIVRALILIDTQAMPEAAATLPYYKQMIELWATQGLQDQLAATIESIILGAGYADAPAWKAKWKT